MKKRYALLDVIRAIALLNMVLYHTIWDMVYIFGYDIKWFSGEAAYIWQQCICQTFIVLSGFCISLSKNKLRNGIKVFLCGAIISLCTIVFSYESRVVFGVLTFIGTCMIFHSFLEKVWQKCSAELGAIISLTLFVITKEITHGYLSFFGYKLIKLPNILYQNYLTAFLGFPQTLFYSTDYFSIIPWGFLFLSGYFFYRLIEKNDLLSKIPEVKIPAIEWIGRNTLVIYMLHQPIIYTMLYFISKNQL